MASYAVSTNRSRREPAAVSNSGLLAPDLLFDVLLWLPAKELCRLRVVCRHWRYLTSDPLFIRAHADRRPEPLFLASFRGDKTHVAIMDLSGNVVKRINNPGGHIVLCSGLELACVATERNYCHALNPATGAVYVLPESPAKEHLNREHLSRPYTSYAFGRVTSTGEYKVLRMFNRLQHTDLEMQQLCELFTVNGGKGHGRWRAKHSRDRLVEANYMVRVDREWYEVSTSVVVDGVVYFLMDDVYGSMLLAGVDPGILADCIASFDLETEEWRKDLQGPICTSFVWGGDDDSELWDEFTSICYRLTLVELEGYLVLTYHRRDHYTLDLWFLTDFDNGVWVKKHSIQTELGILDNDRFVRPLLLLDDGKILIHLVNTGKLLICDPRTNTYEESDVSNLASVGVYTGSLLSLHNGGMV